MYLFFKIEDFYPLGGLSDIEFAFENATELEMALRTKLKPSDYDYASVEIWKIDSLQDFLEMKPYYAEGVKFLVYESRPSATVWKGKNLEKKPEKLAMTLYRDIVKEIQLSE